MRNEKRQWDELWETAVFEGTGCLTLGRMQRFTDWAFDPRIAHAQYDSTVAMVKSEPVRSWLMSPQRVKETRASAIEAFMQPPKLFTAEPDLSDDEPDLTDEPDPH